MESAVAAAVPAEPGLLARIWGTLTSPRRIFESLRAHPRLLGALILLVILNAGASVLMTDLIIEAQQEAMAERGTQVDEAGMARMAQTMKISVPLFGGLGQVALVFILAGIFFFVSNVLLGGSATYKGMASAVAHIGFVAIPALLVKTPLMLAKGDMEAGQTSLAALLPSDDTKSILYAVLSRFDLFELWMWGLAIVAISVMGGIPTRKAATGVVGTWVVLSAIFVILGRFIPGMGN